MAAVRGSPAQAPPPDAPLAAFRRRGQGFLGEGDRGPDVQDAAFGTGDRGFSVRAERGTGHGSTGRIYTETYRVPDHSGNSTVSTAVMVPANASGR